MKVNKKLKMPMIVLGILLLLAGITFRVISLTMQNYNESQHKIPTSTSYYNDPYFGVAKKAMSYNLISTLCLLLGLGVITFASRMEQISGIKLAIACAFFIGCIITFWVLYSRLNLFFFEEDFNRGGTSFPLPKSPDENIWYRYAKPNKYDANLIHASNACAIVGTVVLLL